MVILISGGGSNMQALIKASTQPGSSYEVVAVVSNQAGAGGLKIARGHGIATLALPVRPGQARADYDAELAAQVDSHAPAAVALAGFMRILSAEFIERFRGRLLNIHPSLLPRFAGLHTHRRVLEAGERQHGATVHFVTEELDAGPPVLQATLEVAPQEAEASLAARVLQLEHKIFPVAVQWYCEGTLQWRDGGAWYAGQALEKPIQWTE